MASPPPPIRGELTLLRLTFQETASLVDIPASMKMNHLTPSLLTLIPTHIALNRSFPPLIRSVMFCLTMQNQLSPSSRAPCLLTAQTLINHLLSLLRLQVSLDVNHNKPFFPKAAFIRCLVTATTEK